MKKTVATALVLASLTGTALAFDDSFYIGQRPPQPYRMVRSDLVMDGSGKIFHLLGLKPFPKGHKCGGKTAKDCADTLRMFSGYVVSSSSLNVCQIVERGIPYYEAICLKSNSRELINDRIIAHGYAMAALPYFKRSETIAKINKDGGWEP